MAWDHAANGAFLSFMATLGLRPAQAAADCLCGYGTCRSSQAGCDSTFGNCMRAACDAAYPPDIVTLPGGFTIDRNRVNRSLCRGQANAYESAVANLGGNAHNAAQQNACDCCGTQNCPTCPGGTCSSLPSCQDPGCVCFQTVEGRGFCHLPQSCAGLARCSSSSNCPAGWACVAVTCCVGSGAICIRPCFTISGASSQRSALASAQADGPMTAPVSGGAGRR